ncbi:Myb-like_DNA-binding domain-containing protein [Hexamita inflata]|uniref:Myb-like DNA-binding domain-containing protein n=1 Tax=Hexamita inflata TaxID=28002 RepID=A0AA86N4N6_9EUKA|nr:Myb-like DNA-binding domain-containing protein [Hexamita inflata]CAI9951186.1 Myb-like DNA-binding domain-containing protein [Hexamita inflata]CAI9957859.1 Myb-like DNA-binding domain-containing protein [Hexamita inflata]CAI9961815.1 Myb-like DNA-binding domain-containing protein [Hexamita inflata]CAI9973403.1 Myb-like DNA-binding domain-containing protein [Hexamita inflata]
MKHQNNKQQQKQNNKPNYFPGSKIAQEEHNTNKNPWSRDDVSKLKEIVETLREQGKINWTYVGKQLERNATSCYNKYILLTDHSFTELEDAKLAQWWKKNAKNPDISLDEVVALFQGHQRRAILLQLQTVTKGCDLGEYKMDEKEWRNFEF